MQRGAVRVLDASGNGFDVPLGVFTAALPIAKYNSVTGVLEGSAAGGGSGDFVGPASSVSGNILSFNGLTGKLGQDSGIAASLVTAHASRHNPGGADAMFTGTWAANYEPVWNGSAWVPKRRQLVRKTGTQTSAVTTLAAVTDLIFSALKASSFYRARFVVFYTANATTTGISLAVQASSAPTAILSGIVAENTSQAAFVGGLNVNTGAQMTAGGGVATPAINMAVLECFINTNAITDLQLFFASEVAVASGIVLQANSYAEVAEL